MIFIKKALKFSTQIKMKEKNLRILAFLFFNIFLSNFFCNLLKIFFFIIKIEKDKLDEENSNYSTNKYFEENKSEKFSFSRNNFENYYAKNTIFGSKMKLQIQNQNKI